MTTFIFYLLKAGIAIAAFYILYYFLFRKEKQFQFNRFYLLFSFIVSFLIPLFSFNLPGNILHQAGIPGLFIRGSAPAGTTGPAITILADSYDITGYLQAMVLYGYLSISLVLALRLVYGYLTVYRIIRKASKLTILSQEVLITENDLSPFSFFNKIIIHRSLMSSPDLPVIITHEKVHIKERHNVDLLISEVLFIFHWFNPFAWLLKNAVRANLEYMADHTVITGLHGIENYQLAMVRLAGKRPVTVLATALHVSHLKNRIIMMKRKNQNRFPVLKKLAILPLSIIMVLLISGKQFTARAPSDDIIIHGKVISEEDQSPLMTAFVNIKDKNFGTMTDKDGKYILRVDKNDKVLVFSCLGYESKEVEIKNKKTINVVLKKSSKTSTKTHPSGTYSDNMMTVTSYTDSVTGTIRLDYKKVALNGALVIKGKITSAVNKTPLVGINVFIKGTTVGTICDENGDYLINVKKIGDVLVFVDQKYEPKEVEIKGAGEINVELTPKK